MGVFGQLFPGKELEDGGGEDGDGQTYRPRVAVDLDAGVIRLSPAGPAVTAQEPPDE